MANHPQLKAERRDMLGKKVRRLRKQGVLPATVYGYRGEPQSIQIDAHDFGLVLRDAGRTQLIDLVIDGAPRAVFVKQTAVDAKRNLIQHVEFYQPNLRVPTHTRLPVHVTGESPAVRDGGILLTVLDHVDVESLPEDVPANGIEVDISTIAEINGTIHVADLPAVSGVTILTPSDEVIVKVNPPASEAEVEESLEEAPLPTELGGDEPQPDAVPEA
jgi:large subunit ribosomal protein L25